MTEPGIAAQGGRSAATSMEGLLLAHRAWIERVCEALGRRHGLSRDEVAEFASWAMLRLIEDDYAILRKFRGESALTTYLTVVLAMLLREHRVRCWGRWRPSAAARRSGTLTVRLETLINRDGLTLSEAGELLRTRGETDLSDRALGAMLAQLPRRTPARPVLVPEETAEAQPATASAERELDESERAREAERTDSALGTALERLPEEERLIVRLRYWEGLSVADIARALHLPQKPLYRKLDRALRELRHRLNELGVDDSRVRELLNEEVG